MTDYAEIVKRRMVEIGANNGKPGSTAACLQVESEMVWLAPFIDKLKPKVILEIGIYKAGWPYVLTPFFAEGAYIIGIDAMLRHQWRNNGGETDLWDMVHTLTSLGFKLDVVAGRSDTEAVWHTVRELLHDGETAAATVDVLHIDGAHDYMNSRQDWSFYRPFVRSGGLIILHDIGTQTSQMNVKRLWKEIKEQGFATHEFYEKNGIGVVEM